jgi:hypothetical protein
VRESQSSFSDPKEACSIAYIRSDFWLQESIKRLETQGLLLQNSMDIIKNANEELNVVKEEAGENVSIKLQAVLKETLDYLHLSVSVRYVMETM